MNPIPNSAKMALAAVLATCAFGAAATPVRVAETQAQALQLLGNATGGALSSRIAPIDAYAMVLAKPGQVLLADNASATPLVRAQNFLAAYGALSGVIDPVNQLVQTRVVTDGSGATHVHLNQVQSGLAVFGARLVVHMNSAGITGVNGVFLAGLESLSIAPQLEIAALRERALAAGRKLHGKTLNVESTRLMFYRSGLLKGVESQKDHLAYEVMLKGAPNEAIRERIILDANTGYVVNRIDEIHSILNREIYTPDQNTPPTLTEGSAMAPADPALIPDDRTRASMRAVTSPVNNLYIYAGGTYALYKNMFGREGYDDFTVAAADQVQKSVYLINDACPNAYWNGDSTNYCPGFDADDVVSHEWSHAYTQFTHDLVYQYQSGALNEGYSDIYGEVYDLVNGLEGPLGASLTEGEYFEDGGSRWVVGEDLTEVAAGLLLRDMWDPDAFTSPSPGSVITSPNYFCGTGDGGGVHTNSGVPNHAFAMLVDGKTFNNVTIPKIGMVKAAHIYFRAETVYQTPTTNFNQHADALEASCADLTGRELRDVTGAISSEKIVAADCDAIKAAVLATEMRQSPKAKCNYLAILKPEASTPALCPSGEFVFPTFSENWEGGKIPTGWTQTQTLSGDTEPQPFEWLVTDAAAPHTGKAAFADNNGFGTCAPGGDASAAWSLDSPELTVPEAVSFLSFTHFLQTEALFDGGNLKVSVNGGAFAIVPAAAFTYNAHSGRFSAAMGPTTPTGNNTSPLAGQLAWTGSDQGEATGSWGTTVVDISKLAGAPAKGSKVKFRWEFGQDGCGGNRGWFVDDTQLFYCSKTAPVTASPTAPTPMPSTPAPVVAAPVATVADGGRFGGGALGMFALLPLAAMALRRRRKLS